MFLKSTSQKNELQAQLKMVAMFVTAFLFAVFPVGIFVRMEIGALNLGVCTPDRLTIFRVLFPCAQMFLMRGVCPGSKS